MLNDIVELLNQSRATWAFARERETVQRDALYGEDIDIWCEIKGLSPVSETFFNNGWYLISGRRIGQKSSPWYNVQLRFKNSNNPGPMVDIAFGGLRWQLITYIGQDSIKRNINTIKGIPYIAGAPLLSILITRIALRGELYGERFSRARQAFFRAAPDDRDRWFDQCAELIGTCYTTRIVNYLQSKDNCSHLPSRRMIILKALLSQKAYSCDWLRHILYQTLNQLTRPFRRRCGGIFCVIGTDGTGKTSLSLQIQSALESQNLRCAYIYMGRAKGNTTVVKGIRNLFFSATTTEASVPDSTRVSGRVNLLRNQKLFSNIGALIYWVEYWWRHIFVLRFGNLRALNFVLDRGAFDLLVMPHLWPVVRKIIDILPMPDVLIFCDAPAEDIYSRKQERNIEEIKKHQMIYRDVCHKLHSQIVALSFTTTDNYRESNRKKAINIATSTILAKRGYVDHSILKNI